MICARHPSSGVSAREGIQYPEKLSRQGWIQVPAGRMRENDEADTIDRSRVL